MSIRGIISALIFIVLFFGGIILAQTYLHLSLPVLMGLAFFLGCAYIIWTFLFSQNLEYYRKPVLDTLTGNIKNPISHYVGITLIVIGGILVAGNTSGMLVTFPHAGGICFAVGSGFYAYSKTA